MNQNSADKPKKRWYVKLEVFRIKLDKRKIILFLGGVILFGLLIRLLFGYYKVHYFDVDYYIDWSKSVVNDGIFAAYRNLGDRLDYPPVFLFFLYPTGWMMNTPAIYDFEPYRMLALKMVQIAFDVATIPLIYMVLQKQNKIPALLAASVWALNPAMIFNCGVWGQTDSLMIFFLLLSFWLLEQDKPVAATIVFAIAGLTKFQSLYFAPVFLLFLFYKRNIKKSLLAFGAGIGTGILIFLPFMFYSGVTLPFEVYLGGLGKWTNLTFNAFNFYAALGWNNISDSTELFPGFPVGVISTILLIACVVIIVLLFLRAPLKCPWLLAFLCMNSIFMFGGRMHERYQVPVLIFLLIAAARHHSGRLFGGFIGIAAVSFFNQFFLFDYICTYQQTAWAPYYSTIVVIISIVNLILYALTLYFSLKIMFQKPSETASPAALDHTVGILPPTENPISE